MRHQSVALKVNTSTYAMLWWLSAVQNTDITLIKAMLLQCPVGKTMAGGERLLGCEYCCSGELRWLCFQKSSTLFAGGIPVNTCRITMIAFVSECLGPFHCCSRHHCSLTCLMSGHLKKNKQSENSMQVCGCQRGLRMFSLCCTFTAICKIHFSLIIYKLPQSSIQ